MKSPRRVGQRDDARPGLGKRGARGMGECILGDEWRAENEEPDQLPGDTVLRTTHVPDVNRMALRRPAHNLIRNTAPKGL